MKKPLPSVVTLNDAYEEMSVVRSLLDEADETKFGQMTTLLDRMARRTDRAMEIIKRLSP